MGLAAKDRERAERVATRLCNVPTEHRGEFLAVIAGTLRYNAQSYTASLFEHIAKLYNEGKQPCS
jgi:hypothetical protein